MSAEESKKGSKIFLNDGSILQWERPLPPGTISMLYMYHGKTKPVKSFGFDVIDKKEGRYRVIASAQKFLAQIARSKGMCPADLREELKLEEEILFEGVIAIYTKGQIPGTELEGYDLIREGEIWYAEKPSQQLVKNPVLKHRA